VLKGFAAGAVGGLIGSWLMARSHRLISRTVSRFAAGGCG
jgi:hypothetical protein